MKKIFTVCILLFGLKGAMGQVPGPFYRQFFFNPYLFNPAYVGINNTFEANLAYRQQWTNFKDAPVTAGLNVQFPTGKRVALGFNVYTDKQVLLRNSNFMATFGYVVPLATNQTLRFGISGGMGLNKLDLTAEELNTNDPAVVNASGTNYYVDGNFGVVYTLDGLKVGFALTDLFKSNAFSTQSFNEVKFSNFKNRLFSVSYRFNVGVMEAISLEPYFLYRQTQDGLQDAWEGGAVMYFKNDFWTGVSYNQNNGLALFLGLNVKDRFRLSYSYEFPPFNTAFTATSSHELHLGVKLGKKKSKTVVKTTTTTPVLANESKENPAGGNKNPGRFVTGEEPLQNLETPIELDEKDRVAEPAIAGPKVEETKKAPAKTPSAKPRESFTMTQGHYYVVVGVFSVMSHSMKFTKDMMKNGYHVNVALNPKNNFYYVYIFSSLDHDEVKRVRNEYRWKNMFKEAWIFTME